MSVTMLRAAGDKAALKELADLLTEENQQVYLAKMQELADSFGANIPDDITNEAVLKAIEQRALVSAESIVSTQADRAVALLATHPGATEAAQAAFSDWWAGQSDRIDAYESNVASGIALSDFIDKNPTLSGTARVEPQESAELDDECDEAIAMGDIPIDAIDIDLPAHLNCPHAWAYSFDAVDDPSSLWLGEE